MSYRPVRAGPEEFPGSVDNHFVIDDTKVSPRCPGLDGDVVVDGPTFDPYYENLSTGTLCGARSGTGVPNSYPTYTAGLRQGSAMEAPLVVKDNSGSGWRLWGQLVLAREQRLLRVVVVERRRQRRTMSTNSARVPRGPRRGRCDNST